MNELFSATRIEQPVYFDDLRCWIDFVKYV